MTKVNSEMHEKISLFCQTIDGQEGVRLGYEVEKNVSVSKQVLTHNNSRG